MRLPRLNRLLDLKNRPKPVFQDMSAEGVRYYNQLIADLLNHEGPCAIGKIGTTELMGLEYADRRIQLPWPKSASWYRPAHRLFMCSGVFPVQKKTFWGWAETYRNTLGKMDLLGQWQPAGSYLAVYEDACLRTYAPQARRCGGALVSPLKPLASWIGELTRFRWLVVTPFPKTARSQLPKLANLGIYPESTGTNLTRLAKTTAFLPSPPFAYMVPPQDPDWMAALNRLCREMETQTFDLALIGAGAWSLPLAVHAKSLGKKAIHLGGVTQLLFGIRGERYEQSEIYLAENKNWQRPLPEETPPNHRLMENGAYW